MTRQLIVEGNDEVKIIEKLFMRLKLPRNFELVDGEGNETVRRSLSVRIKAANPEDIIGIVIDAEKSLENSWKSIRNSFIKNGYSVPKSLPKSGGIYTQAELPKVGVWVMPNNDDEGMIEDFIRLLVPENDDLMPLVKQTLTKIQTQNLERFKPTFRAKALIHTWLAWQSKPGTPLGQAVFKKYIDTDKQLCQDFIAWLQQLFDNKKP